MTKQEGITRWINRYLTEQFITNPADEMPDDECLHEAEEILKFLDSEGVVLKVDRELPTIFDINEDCISALEYKKKLAGFEAVEPLMGEK